MTSMHVACLIVINSVAILHSIKIPCVNITYLIMSVVCSVKWSVVMMVLDSQFVVSSDIWSVLVKIPQKPQIG